MKFQLYRNTAKNGSKAHKMKMPTRFLSYRNTKNLFSKSDHI